jgi:hypothetical protein
LSTGRKEKTPVWSGKGAETDRGRERERAGKSKKRVKARGDRLLGRARPKARRDEFGGRQAGG